MTLFEAILGEAGARRKVDRTALWRAFRTAHPVEALAGDGRERLLSRLTELAAQGRIELPSPRGSGWDRSAKPALPEWVRLPGPGEAPAQLDPLAVPWAPELSFVPSLGRIDWPAELLAIQAFFASGGRQRPPVPMRERSVQIFGDEKRLERLLATPLFAEGRLSLEALRCFSMAPPLVFEPGPEGSRGRAVLVVENHHTWWSFCRWNARTGAYAAVVYGAGGAFGRDVVAFLAERCRALDAPHVVYFGDLDPDGLRIPARAATQLAPPHALAVLPADRWYRTLLLCAEGAGLPVGAPLREDEEALSWLPSALVQPVRAHLRAGRRLPQELVGTEVLLGEGREEGVRD